MKYEPYQVQAFGSVTNLFTVHIFIAEALQRDKTVYSSQICFFSGLDRNSADRRDLLGWSFKGPSIFHLYTVSSMRAHCRNSHQRKAWMPAVWCGAWRVKATQTKVTRKSILGLVRTNQNRPPAENHLGRAPMWVCENKDKKGLPSNQVFSRY